MEKDQKVDNRKTAVKLKCLETKRNRSGICSLCFRDLHCLCHFKKEVCVSSLKVHLQPVLSLQNVKSHPHRAKEKRETKNLERKYWRSELKEQQLLYFPSSLIHSFLLPQAPKRTYVQLAMVFNHLLLYFPPYCFQNCIHLLGR